MIRWNTETDEFTEGQWFKGQVYPHFSDLSPEGRLLVYVAAKNSQIPS